MKNSKKTITMKCSICGLKMKRLKTSQTARKAVRTIVCDIDGILCDNKRGLYLHKKPNVRNLSFLRNCYTHHWKIILFTSRLSRYRKSTKKWLKRYNVQYHKLIMDKIKGDVYVDDKALNELRDYSRLEEGLK